MAVKVSRVNAETNRTTLMVTYRLKGDVVVADWDKGVPESYRGFIERDGVMTAKGLFRLKDGQKFLDALELAYSHSSRLVVEKV